MTSAALLRGTGAVGSGSHRYSLTIDSLDVIDAVDFGSIQVDLTAEATGVSQMRFRLENPTGAKSWTTMPWGWTDLATSEPYLWPWRPVLFHDHTDNVTLFGGWLDNVTLGIAYGGGSFINVQCVGYAALLDRVMLAEDFPVDVSAYDDGGGNYSGASAAQALFAQFAATDLTLDAQAVAEAIPGASFRMNEVADFTISAGSSLRGALSSLAEQAGASGVTLWVDNYRVAHFHGTAAIGNRGLAPKSLGSTISGSTIAAETVDVGWDVAGLTNYVYVDGGNAAGSGWVSQLGYGEGVRVATTVPLQAHTSNDLSTTQTIRDKLASGFLPVDPQVLKPAITATTREVRGWDLCESLNFTYPQLLGGTVFVETVGIGITFDRKRRPVYRLTLRGPGWGAIGGNTSVLPVSATTAQVQAAKFRKRS